MILKYVVPPEKSGTVLKNIVRREMNISATLLIKLKKNCGLIVNGVSVFSNYIVSAGDSIELDVEAAESSSDVIPERGKINIIYEDEWFIAINKPLGMIVHPSRAKISGTAQNFVLGYFEETGQPLKCHAVNRLDRDTSGVVIFAKNGYAKAKLTESLAEENGKKTYLAVNYGSFPGEEGIIDVPIKREEPMNIKRIASPDGQRAVTRYKVLERCGGYSFTSFTLETGRTHQIRVHSLCSGYPVLGDVLYYTEESKALSEKLGINGQALHAAEIIMRHPGTNEIIRIKAPLIREDIKALPGFNRVKRMIWPEEKIPVDKKFEYIV